MLRLGWIIVCFAIMALLPAFQPPREYVSADALVLRNGTVIDATGNPPLHDAIVVIIGDRIAAVGPQDRFDLSAVQRVIDVEGQTILPGIINSHTHFTSAPDTRRRFLLDGVTTVCDLGCAPHAAANFHKTQTYAGEPIARCFTAGPILCTTGGYFDTSHPSHWYVGIQDVAQAIETTTEIGRKSDYIKAMLEPGPANNTQPVLSAEELTAIVTTAADNDLIVRAHVRQACVLDVALNAGVQAIEHVPLPFCLESEWSQLVEHPFHIEAYPQLETQIQRMVNQNVYLTPTLEAYQTVCNSEELLGLDEQAWCAVETTLFAIVGRFNALGGNVTLGTDYGVPETQLGMPLVEMSMLHSAGLTNMEIIEAGTRHAAAVCGHGDELGTLEPGKLADVIVVQGDPLGSLTVFDNIQFVIRGGEIVCATEPLPGLSLPKCGL